MGIDVFNSALHTEGAYATVFERDEDTAYFYLLDLTKPESNRIIAALPVPSMVTMDTAARTDLRWADRGKVAGLFV